MKTESSGIEFDTVPAKQKKATLKERFLGGELSDGQWRERAQLVLWYDQFDKLVKIDIENHETNQYAEKTGLDLE